jgi:hypothetical protein
MKKWFPLVCIISFLSGFDTTFAQNASIRQDIERINHRSEGAGC